MSKMRRYLFILAILSLQANRIVFSSPIIRLTLKQCGHIFFCWIELLCGGLRRVSERLLRGEYWLHLSAPTAIVPGDRSLLCRSPRGCRNLLGVATAAVQPARDRCLERSMARR